MCLIAILSKGNIIFAPRRGRTDTVVKNIMQVPKGVQIYWPEREKKKGGPESV